ncbi:TMEM175 family protein [Dermatophilaceae bacterium Soc4.6]
MSGARAGHSSTADGAKGAADRFVFFSDAVVAIALTLLAIELPVPEGASASELAAAFAQGFSEYLAFVISFLVIFLHWDGHHRSFRHLTDSPPALVRWHGLWLFSIVLTPFVTKAFTGGDGDGSGFPWRFGLYAPGQPVYVVLLRLWRRRTPPTPAPTLED